MKKFWTYTQRYIIDWEFELNRTLNWFYDLSFFLDYPAYQLPTLTVKDWLCDNKFLIAEYDENILTEQNINEYISFIPTEFNIKLLTVEEAKQFLRLYYIEKSPWIFIIQEETIDLITGWVISEKLLEII
jgi:hypothetical protein